MTEVEKLIPHRPPFLFVDAILSHEGETLTARRTWRAEEDFYRGHYPGAPITPGVLLSEAVFQTGALLMAKSPDALASIGERERARDIFTDVLSRANSFGILSEDIHPGSGELWGNVPQTYCMAGIINTGMKLSRSWEDAWASR